MTPFGKFVIAVAVLILLGGIVFCLWLQGCPAWSFNEPGAWRNLRSLTAAEQDFFEQDRNENGIKDYWRADVAGLYTQTYHGESLRLIELSCAVADDRPVVPAGPRASKSGYWYRAIRFADEAKPDPSRFSFCAFPDENPKTGRYTFIIRENNVIFRKDLGKGRGIDVWPDDPEKAGWTKLDY